MPEDQLTLTADQARGLLAAAGIAVDDDPAASALVVRRAPTGRMTVDPSSVVDIVRAHMVRASDASTSEPNRFAGVVTRIERDKVAALVEVQAGPHRIVSMLTAEALDAHRLRVGQPAVASVKATSVSVEPREEDGAYESQRPGSGRP